jgi:hypothetical protein
MRECILLRKKKNKKIFERRKKKSYKQRCKTRVELFIVERKVERFTQSAQNCGARS